MSIGEVVNSTTPKSATAVFEMKWEMIFQANQDCRINATSIQMPKYWNSLGSKNDTYFKGIAINGTESVYMIEEAKPTP